MKKDVITGRGKRGFSQQRKPPPRHDLQACCRTGRPRSHQALAREQNERCVEPSLKLEVQTHPYAVQNEISSVVEALPWRLDLDFPPHKDDGTLTCIGAAGDLWNPAGPGQRPREKSCSRLIDMFPNCSEEYTPSHGDVWPAATRCRRPGPTHLRFRGRCVL